MNAAQLQQLRDELTSDPTGIGYAEALAIGADAQVAEKINAAKRFISAESGEWAEYEVTAADVAEAIRDDRIDAAVESYKLGQWPAVDVYIPADRCEAEGLTRAHFAAAKINHEGTALGVTDDALRAEALAIIGANDQARALDLAAKYPEDVDRADRYRLERLADEHEREAARLAKIEADAVAVRTIVNTREKERRAAARAATSPTSAPGTGGSVTGG